LLTFEDYENNAVAVFWAIRLAWQGVTAQSQTGGDALDQIRYEIYRERNPSLITEDYHK
jgi:hypothetical protein